MKPTLAILVLCAVTAGQAQQPKPKPPTQPLPPIEPAQAVPAEPATIEKSVNDIVRRSIRLGEEAAAGGVNVALSAAPVLLQRAEAELQDIHGNLYAGAGTSRGNRSLVITTSEPDPVANANTEEDLAIMSRILRKAVGNSQDERRRPLGIEVDGSVFGSASGARNIYIDGYGAIFLLTVRYPLIGAPDKPDEAKTKDTTSDEWKEAREEELQSRPGGYDSASGGFGQTWVWSGSGRTPAEDFDGEKVEKLKTALLESLKNATHVRALKPNDFVTVVVQGGEATRVESVKRKPTTTAVGKPADSDNNKAPGTTPSKAVVKSSRSRSSLGETVMTIRVKKSDADAFAQGKLDLDAFRKKASLQTYFRRTDSTTASAFLPVVR